MHGFTAKRDRFSAAPVVGLFGKLGSGNIGNDASMETMLNYLKADHPNAVLDAMCSSPKEVRSEYGIDAIALLWYEKFLRWYQKIRRRDEPSALTAIMLKALGKGIDVFRTASWVRRHDVVVVPGMGVLESSLRHRPRGFPYSLFLLSATGRVFGTKVALVSVGANVTPPGLTRWLLTQAARLAYYRSYRDTASRDTMRQQGVNTAQDPVYPDLVFGLPTPPADAGDARIVGIGVMDYHGSSYDRKQAENLYISYVEQMKIFVRWLVDSGHKVRLFVGDTNGSDDRVAQEIMTDIRVHRPNLEPARLVAEPVYTYEYLMRAIAPVGIVVAARYHGVLCALKLSKPTISIGYGAKHNNLMADMGLSEFCQSIRSLDVAKLVEKFKELEGRSEQLRQTMKERNMAKAQLLDDQFKELSAALFSGNRSGDTASAAPPPGRTASSVPFAPRSCGRTR
jgi:polysaccharide pyruvyl transferase WcaK-like protein